MSPERQSDELDTVMQRMSKGTKVMIIQVPGNGLSPVTRRHANLQVCAISLESLLGLTEAGFIEKMMDKDIILFTRLHKGSKLLGRITRDVLSSYLGRTAAAIIEKTGEEDPLSYSNLMSRISDTMGAGAQLIKHAVAKALYDELRSNPGALQSCTTTE
jgi:hypothetical protein